MGCFLFRLCGPFTQPGDLLLPAEERIGPLAHGAPCHGASRPQDLPVQCHQTEPVPVFPRNAAGRIQILGDEHPAEKHLFQILDPRGTSEKIGRNAQNPRLLHGFPFQCVGKTGMHRIQRIKGRPSGIPALHPLDDLAGCLRRICHDIGHGPSEHGLGSLRIRSLLHRLAHRAADAALPGHIRLQDRAGRIGETGILLFRLHQILPL